jgi:hypothetical protein
MNDADLPIDPDGLAGVTALFGALTRVELRRAVTLLCDHRGQQTTNEAVDHAIDQGLSSCRLLVAPLAVDPPLEDAPIVAGPHASPTLPEEAAWLLAELPASHRQLDVSAVWDAADTELDRAIRRAREEGRSTTAEELATLHETLHDWLPITIGPGLLRDDGLPIDADELAGIVEPFGALTRLELRQAASVLCYRRGVDVPELVLEYAIDRALSSAALLVAPLAVPTPLEDAPIVAGPTASPSHPGEFDDLVGLLGVDPRPIDPTALERAAENLRQRIAETGGAVVNTIPAAELADALEAWDPTTLRSPMNTGTDAPDGGASDRDSRSDPDAAVASDAPEQKEGPSADGPLATDDAPRADTSAGTGSPEESAAGTHADAPPLTARPSSSDEAVPLDPSELAGITELFGALTRSELRRAASELCYRRGVDVDDDPLDVAIDRALSSFALLAAPGAVESAPDGVPLLAGPAAFPTLPDHAEDLPHILDAEERETDREAARNAAVGQLRTAIDATLDDADPSTAERLLELCYDLETWGAVDLDEECSRLRALVDQGEQRSAR